MKTFVERMQVLLVAAVALCGPAAAQFDLHKVDFKDFSYPMSGSTLGHNRLVWLNLKEKNRTVRLIHGKGHGRSSGFRVDSVNYGDVTGDGKEDAIVVVHYDTGGTQQTDYIYIFGPGANGPELLAYCYTGDRADSGLNKAYADRGRLAIELFDAEKQEGACCSTGIVRTRFRWRNGRFEAVGKPEREDISEPKTGP